MDERRPERSARRQPSIGALSVLPVFYDLKGKRVVVIGGAAAIVWKAELLAAAGATLDVFAEAPHENLQALAADTPGIRLIQRLWTSDDLRGATLAVGDLPEDSEALRFKEAAQLHGVPANVVDRPAFCDFQFGSIIERSPLVIGVSTAGAAPVLAQAVRSRIEAVLPQSLRAWAARAASWRSALKECAPDARLRRRFWALFAARALQADVAPPTEDALDPLLEKVRRGESHAGSVTLVGAGPGDPELLTMKALRALQSADAVLHDDLASTETLALARREAEKITVGKRGYKPSCTQEDISNLMIELARSGKRVVRLKGGDPCIFGRANEEIDALAAANVEVEIIPGVTSASAAAAAMRRSLTERALARRVQFITAHAQNGRLPTDLNWQALIDANATTAVYMGLRTLPALVDALLREGLDPLTPAAVVENASREQERVIAGRIADLPKLVRDSQIAGPSLVLFGKALNLP